MSAQYELIGRKMYVSWRERLLVVSLLLSTATQLRMAVLPMGVGELGLVLWLTLFVYVLSVKEYTVNRLFVWYAGFWFVSIPSLILGTVIAAEIGEIAPLSKYIRELLALVFVTLFCLVLAIETGTARDSIERIARLIKYVGAFVVIVFLVSVTGLDFIPIEWWLGNRFQGLSENPNQYALLLVPLPFLVLYLFTKTHAHWLYLLIALLLVVTGLLTGSDALVLGWVAGSVFYFVYRLIKCVSEFTLIPVFLLFFVSVTVLLSMVLWSLGVVEVREIVSGVYGAGSDQYAQSFRRFDLWANGIIAGMDSPMFGLGPGNHSGFGGPHQGSEAHNSLIDWFTISGIVGLSAFVVLFIAQFRSALQASPWLASAMVAILVFISFHYMFRHPLFWFYMILIGQLSLVTVSASGETRGRVSLSAARPV